MQQSLTATVAKLQAYQEWQPIMSGYAQKLKEAMQVQAQAANAFGAILPKIANNLSTEELEKLQQAFDDLQTFNSKAGAFNDQSLTKILATAKQLEEELRAFRSSNTSTKKDAD